MIMALKAHKWDYEKSVVLSDQAKSDLHWWVANVETSFGAIFHEKPSLVLHTDASKTGWGAVHVDSHTGVIGHTLNLKQIKLIWN